MKDWKDNICFVLVEPKEPGNIGASARALKNMGFRNLCLVKPPEVMTDEAKWFARNALDVLESAGRCDSVADAVKDKSIVVGTTRRTGKKRGVILSVDDGAEKIYDIAAANRVAILFGREARGLFNEEVEECGFLLTIPSSKSQPSLNLSQAVLLVAYELSKAEYRGGSQTTASRRPCAGLVEHADISALFDRLSGVLRLLEYLPRGDRDLDKKIMRNLKHFIGRAGLTGWELNMLLGICTQIEKKIGDK
jgi:TrmH family RNA methyltransferase